MFLTAGTVHSVYELGYSLEDRISKPGSGKEHFYFPKLPRPFPVSTRPSTESLTGVGFFLPEYIAQNSGPPSSEIREWMEQYLCSPLRLVDVHRGNLKNLEIKCKLCTAYI